MKHTEIKRFSKSSVFKLIAKSPTPNKIIMCEKHEEE